MEKTTNNLINNGDGVGNNTNNDKDIIEEDWSCYFKSTQEDDRSDNDNNNSTSNYDSLLTGFARHFTVTIPLQVQCHPPQSSTKAPAIEATMTIGMETTNETTMQMKLSCIESLTPLDMMNLSNGDHDATGHRVWMGSLFFIECFACPLTLLLACAGTSTNTACSPIDSHSHSHPPSDPLSPSLNSISNTKLMITEALHRWREILFHEKHIVELGAGTGASGISIMVVGESCTGGMKNEESVHDNNGDNSCDCHDDRHRHNHHHHHHHHHHHSHDYCDHNQQPRKVNHGRQYLYHPQPASIVFTDSDPNVLELCQKNIQQNIHRCSEKNNNQGKNKDTNNCSTRTQNTETKYSVCQLEWGTLNPYKATATDTTVDTIIATDVIYDIAAIQPLFQTASSFLARTNGYFVLSHIPRASLDYNHDDSLNAEGTNNDKKQLHSSSSSSSSSLRDKIEALILKEASDCRFDLMDWMKADVSCRPNGNDNNNNNTESNSNTTDSTDGQNPKATYSDENDKNKNSDVNEHEYSLERIIRPKDLMLIREKMITSTSNVLDYKEMQLVGAGIFIFKYNGTKK